MSQTIKNIHDNLFDKKRYISQLIPTYIYQKDFNHGTYIIDQPGHYIIKENIVFNPNPSNDYLPNQNDQKYKTLSYTLGFFAVIVIATNDVYLDLNNKTISASPEFV